MLYLGVDSGGTKAAFVLADETGRVCALDTYVGWAGSLVFEPGVNIIAGTGSVVFGVSGDGRTERAGGGGAGASVTSTGGAASSVGGSVGGGVCAGSTGVSAMTTYWSSVP